MSLARHTGLHTACIPGALDHWPQLLLRMSSEGQGPGHRQGLWLLPTGTRVAHLKRQGMCSLASDSVACSLTTRYPALLARPSRSELPAGPNQQAHSGNATGGLSTGLSTALPRTLQVTDTLAHQGCFPCSRGQAAWSQEVFIPVHLPLWGFQQHPNTERLSQKELGQHC